MADVEYSDRAAEWMRKADPDASEQVAKKIDEATDFPDHFLKRLSNSPYYRLRAGDYRAIIDWRKGDDLLFIRRINSRDVVYDR